MRRRVLTALVAVPLLAWAASAAPEGPGIRWEPDVAAGLRKAELEGRPILIAVNALENERANNMLAQEAYRGAAWGDASRGYVCLVGNPGEHTGPDGLCRRYPGIPCSAHREALDLVLARFSPTGELISPQHLFLEPSGEVAWRKEYYTGVVGPKLLETWFLRLAPALALDRAGLAAESRIEDLAEAEPEDATRRATEWLRSGDPFAVGGVLLAMESADDAVRSALLRSLGASPPEGTALLEVFARDIARDVDLEPELALAYAAALRAADAKAGARMYARMAVTTTDEAYARRAIAAWRGNGNITSDLETYERVLLAEALVALGDARAREAARGFQPADRSPRVLRVLARAGVVERRYPPLTHALDGHDVGTLRGALLESGAGEVRGEAERVQALHDTHPAERIRVAAALALLRAGQGGSGAVTTLLVALGDPVEGPEARVEAVARLGEDPGYAEEVWADRLAERMGGAR